MPETPRLDAYHFDETEWDDYDHLREEFEWKVPDRFNMAAYVCDRWATTDPVDGGESGDERVALYTETAAGEREQYTYEEFHEVTNRLANCLADAGIERGDRIGVNAPQTAETVFTHVAAWKLGAVSIPLSTLFGPDAISYRLDDSESRLCVVDESNVDAVREAADEVPSLERILTVGDVDTAGGGDGAVDAETDFWEALEGCSSEFDTVDTEAEEDAIIMYTSGTTGEPKGVRHAHRMLLGHLPLFLTTFCNLELADDDVYYTPAEWAWIASLFDVVVPGLYYGKPIVAYDGGQFDPEVAFEILERYDVTNFFAPPTALRMMMQTEEPSERYDIDSVRVIPSGGESLGQSIVDWAEETFDGAAVHEGYGQTEANLLVGDCTALAEFREGKMGLAAPGHDVRIVDTETAEPTVETGEIGEIAVRYEGNPVCFKEYLNKPERTERKVRNGWLLTEDLGTVDEDGYFTFKSRKDDVIISAGYRIGPEEIEESLAGHEAVADAAVIGVPDDERGEVPKAYVVTAAGTDLADAEGDDGTDSDSLEDTLQEHVRTRLAQYEYPREIEFVEELPKTATGKVRRADLREAED
ncbi:acyl-CoA synthetase [Natronorubrum texcoconense]|uniref:Acetyl-CoA synthetase n=1 Tax=Natronorubrum texcoconense TaxID=1095776 RepID=A0A1G8T5K8_9EURY|nr:AMP-binding protein [Natronorubrum texcoconense]SDJ36832.1 acetyl-CoA synthetase [Natronorubrum texcoconense]